MRRGHSGIGGWRSENPRLFRPRNGGNQHFRPSRSYGLLDQHRFPPPISRPHRPSLLYKHRSDSNDRSRLDHHDRGKYRAEYRPNCYPRNQDESHQPQDKNIFSMSRPTRLSETAFKHSNKYPTEPSNYFGNVNKHSHMNNMGDIDDRYIPPRETFRQNIISPWAGENNFNKYGERAHRYEHNKTNQYDGGESSKLPLYDYTGHRPPSNDHYGGNPTPVINNSGSFNRSVDDTVDLIRKRLLNRKDPYIETTDNFSQNPIESPIVQKTKECNQNFNQEQPSKKKANRQRRSSKSCNDTSFTKIKSKIVNQLFKMDKEKIHKLMDNPNSSSKFEYAISSLITESQYSFNRHLRSVAEKSLHTSSSIDFIQNDNNTIYEDTFMKQMQCILDPQDTVLLEDIKPIVMAELSKALQLDEYDQQFEMGDEFHQQKYEHSNYESEMYDDEYAYDDYATSFNNYTPEQKFPISQISDTQSAEENHTVHNQDNNKIHSTSYNTNDTMFEIPTRRRSNNLSPERVMTLESPKYTRKSLDDRLNELFSVNTHSNSENPVHNSEQDSPQLFVPNAEPLEDEDDPFAELDKQYHVAVDHSFIDNDDSPSINTEKDYIKSPSSNTPKNIALSLNTPEKESIKQEIDHQLQDMANSPLKLPEYVKSQIKSPISIVKKELTSAKDEKKDCDNSLNTSTNSEKSTCSKACEEVEFKEAKKEIGKSETPLIMTIASASASRKRSIDQSPAHRKEKRKKSNSVSYDSEKQIPSKSLPLANENLSKLPKKEQDKQSFPEKHNKRKETQKKVDQKTDELPKKTSISTENLSSGVILHNTTICKSNIKTEAKTTLKTFDLFTEQPKKVNVHHAHRNTALAPANIIKSNSETRPNCSESKTKKPNKIIKKILPTQVGKNVVSVQTQTIELRNTCTRFSQTDRKKHFSKAIQTNIVPQAINQKETKDPSADPLERMKEIDMEIQVLLQEKFKLYNSIESKDSDKKSLHTLGMALVVEEEIQDDLSQNTSQENISTEDSIVEDFTNIPTEELEQIALESLVTKQTEDPKPIVRSKRLRVLEREKSKSHSPTPINQRKNKKIKTPNISLIEEIISDERPIEDIISLEDLEHTPVKARSKNIKSKRKAKKKSATAEKPLTHINTKNIILKDCSVLVVREDISKYLSVIDTENSNVAVNEFVQIENQINSDSNLEQNNMQDDPIVNDIHFDMLDVSEDIVIGDNCEIKSVDDKEELSATDIPITEDIILDNSQSSLEETQGSTSDPKENECKMFDYSADENLRRDSVVVTGNADAVLAVECIENNFIAACLDGNVYYFSGDGQLITTLRGSNLAVTCLTIVKEKYGTTVYTGSLDSRIRYYDLDTGLEKGPECNVLSPIQTMDRAWDTVFVGTRTGFVLQFECKNNMLIPISTVQFSDQSILALRAMKEGARKVLLVAARSEDVTIKDAQTGLLLRTLAGPKMTVYTLLYEDGKIYCGTSSSQIHVYDYSSGSHVGAHEGGKGAVCLRASGGLLFAGCYDGCVYVYREGERRPFAQLRGPSLMLLSLAVVGSKIIAGYKDRSLYIWKIPLSILQEMIL